MADQETGPASVDVASDGAEDTAPVSDMSEEQELETAVSSDPRIAPIFQAVNRMQQEVMDMNDQRQEIINEINALPATVVGDERTRAIEASKEAIARLEQDMERKRQASLALVEAMNKMREALKAEFQ